MGDVRVAGARHDVRRCALLDDATGVDEDEVVGQGEGVERVVRHEHGRPAVGAQPGGEGRPDLRPQLGVEGREGLVEQEQARVGRQRPREGDPLGLAVREPGRPRRGEVERPERVELRVGASGGSRALDAAAARTEGDVGPGGEVGEEQVVGRQQADASQRRVDVDAVARPRGPVDPDVPRVQADEPRQRVQRRRLARTVRPEHGDDLAVGRAQGQVEVERAAADPHPGVEGHRSHRPRSVPSTATATTSIARLRATAVCGSSCRAT